MKEQTSAEEEVENDTPPREAAASPTRENSNIIKNEPQQQKRQQQERPAVEPNSDSVIERPPLYKSSRLKHYLVLAFSSFINYDAAERSYRSNLRVAAGVPATQDERRYAAAVSLISLALSGFATFIHLDRFTPLQQIWQSIFQSGSKMELALAWFLVIWWSVAVGVETSVTGMAGDAKGQYSFYFSAWLSCITAFGILDLWHAAAGKATVRAFITSWPNRAPAWLCILALSIVTLIWYWDLWQNHEKLNAKAEQFILEYFQEIGEGQWYWLIIVTVYTALTAAAFVVVELFRETKQDGSSPEKKSGEKTVEGLSFLSLILAWVPTVMVATTPGGAAALNGNAYFFTWLLVIFTFEGAVWFMHDMRKDLHRALKEKEEEYRKRQKQVLERTQRIIERQQEQVPDDDNTGAGPARERIGTEYFDAADTF